MGRRSCEVDQPGRIWAGARRVPGTQEPGSLNCHNACAGTAGALCHKLLELLRSQGAELRHHFRPIASSNESLPGRVQRRSHLQTSKRTPKVFNNRSADRAKIAGIDATKGCCWFLDEVAWSAIKAHQGKLVYVAVDKANLQMLSAPSFQLQELVMTEPCHS